MAYRYFENRDCPYYPCHSMEHVNCLFCFCPLYTLPCCGGDCTWITQKDGTNIKDCSACSLPHTENGYDYVMARLSENSKKE